MLEIGGFKSGEPGAPGVDRLGYGVGAHRRCRARLEVLQDKTLRYDRICQVLVEKSRRDHSERVQVMLDQHVEIIGRFRLEIGIA